MATNATSRMSACYASASTPLASAPRRQLLRTDFSNHRLRYWSHSPWPLYCCRCAAAGASSCEEAPATGPLLVFLQQLAAIWELDLRAECVDIKRSAKHDLSLPKVRNSYLDRIRAIRSLLRAGGPDRDFPRASNTS